MQQSDYPQAYPYVGRGGYGRVRGRGHMGNPPPSAPVGGHTAPFPSMMNSPPPALGSYGSYPMNSPPPQGPAGEFNDRGGGFGDGPAPQQQQQFYQGPPPPMNFEHQGQGKGPQFNPQPQAYSYQQAPPYPFRGGRGRGGGAASHSNSARQLEPPPPTPLVPFDRDESAYRSMAHSGVSPVPQSPVVPEAESPMVDLGLRPAVQRYDSELLEKFDHQYKTLCDDTVTEVSNIDLNKCLETINANDVTFVVTDTGSGKSSLVPKHILEVFPESKIIASQTRRTAAMSLAHRVAQLTGTKPGEDVGYWVRGDHCGSFASTRLMYLTSYLLLLHIINNPEDLKATHIIIDEFHERSSDIEITLALLRKAFLRGLKFKVILLSATVESDAWQEYFEGLKVGVYDETVPRFNVNTWFMDDIHRLVNFAKVTISPEEVDTCVKPETSLNFYMMMRELVAMLATRGAVEHAILVFLPGRNEISKTVQWINTFHADVLDPIEWFADIDLEKIREQIDRPPTDNRKKVYLATDIAEVSVTVPDVVFIVDTGLTRKPRINEADSNSVAFPALETVAVMRTSVRQRMGRVGRVRQGFYFSLLCTETLPFLRNPEGQILNSVLDTLTLHVLQISENPRLVFHRCATRPREVALRLSLHKLLDNGAIVTATQRVAKSERRTLEETRRWRIEFSENNQDDKKEEDEDEGGEATGDRFFTTAKGQIIQFLPLRVACADLVFWGMLTGITEIAIVAACIAEVGSPFYTQTGTRKPALSEISRTREIMLRHSKNIPSDIIAGVSLIACYKEIMGTTSEAAREEWCQQNCASASRIESILLYETSVLDAISERIAGLKVNPTPEVLKAQLRESSKVLDLITGVAFSINSIWVQNDAQTAQQLKFVGKSLFLNLRALADFAAASTCTWPRGKTVVPTNLRLIYRKLLAHSNVQFDRSEFNALCMCTSTDLTFAEEATNNGAGSQVICRFERQGREKYVRASVGTFEEVLLLRDAISAQMKLLFMFVGAFPTEADLQSAFEARGRVGALKNHASLPRFISKLLLGIVQKREVEDLFHENFVPTHRSMLRAGATDKTSVMPYSEADDVRLVDKAEEEACIIED